MAEFRVEFEWEDPGAAKGPELRATWARLQLLVNNQPLTQLIDHRNKSVRTSVYLPLYPLAEWLALNWNFLFNEIPSPQRDNPEHSRRHNLRFAGEGFALPALAIDPVGTFVRLQWQPASMEAQSVQFTGSGSAFVPKKKLEEAFRALISQVLTRLTDFGVSGTLLSEEWQAIESAPREEREFAAASAALGLDPFSVTPEQAADVIAASESLPPTVQEDFFAVADPKNVRADLALLVQSLKALRNSTVHADFLADIRKDVIRDLLANVAPWEQGYRVASYLRDTLQLQDDRLASYEALGRAFHLKTDLSSVIIQTKSNLFDALVAPSKSKAPAFAIAQRNAASARFALCRALFEYLISHDDEPRLITSSYSDRQKRNRAFAAEFLLPAALLRRTVMKPALSEPEIDDLATEFGVSSLVVAHQLENHGIAKVLLAAS